ncbi:MAG: hypothetical protein ACK4NZ_09950 [Tsuneonella sp.]
MTDLAPLIAIIGADGSGKTTLANDLASDLARERPARYVYLGLGSGVIGHKIAELPLIGRLVSARIEKRAGRARDPKDKIPGPVTALVVYFFSTRRMKRFRAMMDLRRAGTVVITDRYPQLEMAGFYDGPGLSTARAEWPFVRWLAKREAKLYTEMVRNKPTLVLRLNIDADTALARKPEHGRDLVEKKIAITPLLTFGGARIEEIDATMDYPAERALARRLIDQVLSDSV